MTAPAVRSLQSWAYRYKRTWRGSAFSSVLQPVLFLAAMGLGLGSLVNQGQAQQQSLGGIEYIDFLAPALLAAAAMQTAAMESSWPVMAAVKWLKTYDAMLATPLRIRDVFTGHLTWITMRVSMGAAIFIVVMALFGTIKSVLGIFLLPAAVLTGLAFAAPTCAFSVTLERDSGLTALFRFGIIPMFLFSGTFFPVSQLPGWAQPLAELSPLYHGVELCRAATTGTGDAGAILVHIVVLVGFVAAGAFFGARSFTRRLSS
jgi:lipooligosaccharide transport system permease protein